MKAQVLLGVNNLKYSHAEMPVADENHYVVKVMASGICGSDVDRVYKSGAHNMPLIPGHEFAGHLMGDENKRVGVFPLIPCMKCGPCLNKRYEMCRHYDYLGSRCDGGFAQYVKVPRWNVIELPEEVSYQAAAMLEPMAVAVHGIRQMFGRDVINGCSTELKGKTILVCGLGTIGLMTLTFLISIIGNADNIYAIGNKDFQKKNAVNAGLMDSHYADSRSTDINSWIKENADSDGVDYYFECVGRNETVSQGIDCTRPGGHMLFLGNPASDMSFDRDTYWKILRNQLTVHGTWNSSFTHDEDDDWHFVLKSLKEKKINPELFITHRLALSQLKNGLAIMRDKTEEYIKIVVTDFEQ